MLGIFGTVDKRDPEVAARRQRPRGNNAMARKKHEPGFFGERSFQRPTVSFDGYGSPASNNWTKNNPCLQADIFGDWREEVIYRDSKDPSVIYVYTSQIPTSYRYPTLMSDHVYRLGVAWQNVGYNQPPHVGVYMPDALKKYNP